SSPSSGAAPLSGETPVALGAPTAPPAESTIPAPYVTPGLADANGGALGSQATALQSTALQAKAAAAAANPDAPQTFAPRGKTYGAPANASQVAFIARRPALLVVSAGETVVFAQQLQAGEAYRAPMQGGLLIDVSDPAAYDVYVGGQLRAPLPQTKTPLSQIAGKPAPAVAAPVAKPAQD
ncbi:MAG: helix-turn-helix domain-containing protein, partial [Caulobacteraceae bacterium]